MAKLIAKPIAKHVIPGKVQNWDHRIFTVEAVAASEQLVVVQFSRRVRYRVVKLSISDLPPTDQNGKKITWVNNFAVQSPSGHYMKRVHYTVFLRKPRGRATYIYFDHRGLRRDKKPKPKGSKPPQPGMVQVDFTTGDPGHGWT